VNVLIYLEPVVFRRDPLLLRPWVEWLSDMLKVQRTQGESIEFSICSSRAICNLFLELGGVRSDMLFACQQSELLKPFDFQRYSYTRDLFEHPRSSQPANQPLLIMLDSLRRMVNPDVVVSFSENRYLRRSFPQARLLFCELAPLPRLGAPQFLFTDPRGHQADSLLGKVVQPGLEQPVLPESPDINRLFVERIQSQAVRHPMSGRVAIWLDSIRKGRRVALMALQPEDWLTFEGSYRAIAIENLALQWLRELPTGWVGVPTYYPGTCFSSVLEAGIADEVDNVAFAPPEISSGLSELFVPHIDALVTISSTVALTTLLYGKPIVVAGITPFSAFSTGSVSDLDHAPVATAAQRASTLAFLSNGYCHALAQVRSEPGYFSAFLRQFATAEDQEAFFTDLSGWTITKLERIIRTI